MYAGAWEGDKKYGIGYQSITNGATYYGEWENNIKEGLGYEIGTSFNYKGEWKNDKPHGRGVVSMEGRTDHYAIFENGELVKRVKLPEVAHIIEDVDKMNFDHFMDEAKTRLDGMEQKIDQGLTQVEMKNE